MGTTIYAQIINRIAVCDILFCHYAVFESLVKEKCLAADIVSELCIWRCLRL